MCRKLNAFIFDLDGVITDTSEYHYLAWKRLAAEEDIPFTRRDNEQLRGVSRRRSLELLLKQRKGDYSEEELQEMTERKNGYYQQYLNTISSDNLLPGIKSIINDLKNRGLKIAIASSSKNAKIVIKNLKIESLFDTISDGFSVEKTKPAPELFLHTAKNLGIKAEECVVVEDARSGIEAALAAGMVAVGIGPEKRVGKAHYSYDRVADIKLEEIIGAKNI